MERDRHRSSASLAAIDVKQIDDTLRDATLPVFQAGGWVSKSKKREKFVKLFPGLAVQ